MLNNIANQRKSHSFWTNRTTTHQFLHGNESNLKR